MAVTPNAERLIELLREIWDDRDFILGVMSNTNTVENRDKLIEFIEFGKEKGIMPDSDAVLALSVRLCRGL